MTKLTFPKTRRNKLSNKPLMKVVAKALSAKKCKCQKADRDRKSDRQTDRQTALRGRDFYEIFVKNPCTLKRKRMRSDCQHMFTSAVSLLTTPFLYFSCHSIF